MEEYIGYCPRTFSYDGKQGRGGEDDEKTEPGEQASQSIKTKAVAARI